MKPEEKNLIKKIIALTTLIQERYPELIYELEEYNYYTGGGQEPINLKDNLEVDIVALSGYLDSLKETVKHYILEKNKKDLYLIEHL
jgi:hypothetical protein